MPKANKKTYQKSQQNKFMLETNLSKLRFRYKYTTTIMISY